MQEIVLAPAGTTGWRTHPGPALALIQSGSLTVTDAANGECHSTTYGAGDTFVDPGQGHIHMATNPGSDNVVVYVACFDVPAGGTPRIDAPAPGC